MEANTIFSIAIPASNLMDFVFNEILLPILIPTIEPIKTQNADNQIMFPRYQYIGIAPKAVKIDTVNEVAIAL